MGASSALSPKIMFTRLVFGCIKLCQRNANFDEAANAATGYISAQVTNQNTN
jgi:hypothetical protein